MEGRAAAAQPSPFTSRALPWSVLALAIFALAVLSFAGYSAREAATASPEGMPLGARPIRAPDISSMSPQEQADRLFDRVMRLSGEGKADSAVFFGSMALSALDALAPHTAHHRYDIGLVALVLGHVPTAAAQADTILARRPTHLLGLALAARVADARGDAAASREFRRRLAAAEPAERALALPEYSDHDADIRALVQSYRGR